MGRNKKPLALLRLSGSWRYKEALKKGALDLPPEMPAIPDELSGVAREVYCRMAEMLFDMGVIHTVDCFALERYAFAWEQWAKTTEELRNSSAMLQDSEGKPYINPLVKLQSMLALQLSDLEKQFGLTPVARAKLKITPGKPDVQNDLAACNRARRIIPLRDVNEQE